MVTVYGLNEKIGNISYYDSSGQNEYGFTKPYSEETARLIDMEVREIIEGQYTRAKDILRKNKDKLTALAEQLLDKEVIFKEDLLKIFGERPFAERVAAPTTTSNGKVEDAPAKPADVAPVDSVKPAESVSKPEGEDAPSETGDSPVGE